MGFKTRDELITEGLEKAARPDITTRAQKFLEMWLDTVYASFPWRFLRSRYGPYTITSGSSSFEFGDTASGIASAVTDRILSIKRILIGDTANGGYQGECFTADDGDIDAELDPGLNDTTLSALPERALVSPAISGSYVGSSRWLIQFPYKTDKAYRALVVAHKLPDYPSSGTVKPYYPNDSTMVQAIFLEALKYQKDDRVPFETAVLEKMMAEDKRNYGPPPGRKVLRLSRRRFPGRGIR